MERSEIEEKFDQVLSGFFGLCHKLVEEKKQISLIRSDDRAQIKRLTEFMRTYGETKSGDKEGEVSDFFLDLFSGLYAQKKKEFLSLGPGKPASWLSGSNITLVFGSNWEEPNTEIALPLSFIYRYAEFISKEYQRRAEGDPETYGGDSEHAWKLQATDMMFRLLYTILALTDEHLEESSEKQQGQLERLKDEFGDALGIKEKSGGGFMNGIFGDLLGDMSADDILEGIPSYIEQTMDALPPQLRSHLPATGAINQAIGELTTDQKLKNTLLSMGTQSMEQLESNRNPDGTINYFKTMGDVFGNLMKPDTVETLGEAFEKMMKVIPADSGLPMMMNPGAVPTIPGLAASTPSPMAIAPTPSPTPLQLPSPEKEEKMEDEEIPFI